MESFNLEIITPDREFFSGPCESLTVTTPQGEMGIMAGALPLVANLTDGGIKILQKNKWMRAYVGSGFIKTGKGGAVMLVQSAEWPYEIKEKDVQDNIDRLESRLKKEQSLKEYRTAKAQLARQLARLRVKKEI